MRCDVLVSIAMKQMYTPINTKKRQDSNETIDSEI